MNSTPKHIKNLYSSYRFGFNAQVRTDEVSGAGNHNTALFWEYDTRTGRRWNLDPKPMVGISDYACFGGNPIFFSDVLGDTIKNKNIEKLRDAKNNLNIAEENLELTYSVGDKLLKFKPLYNSLIEENKNQIFKATKEVAKQTELIENTEAVINEFKTVNPETFNYWNNHPYVIDVESQNEKIKIFDQKTGQQSFTTTDERVSCGIKRSEVLLTKTNYKDLADLSNLTFHFVHAIGHINDYLKNTRSDNERSRELSADKYATENYSNIKKRK